METFLEYVDKKGREAKKHLNIVKKVLEHQGFKLQDFLEEEEPYIFLQNPDKRLSFDGVRIYNIGSQMAYRVQRENKTQPYGRAYPLNIEDMFRDFLSDKIEEEKAGKMVIKTIAEELQKFFRNSAGAEADLMTGEFGGEDPSGSIIVKNGGRDYANLITTKA